MNYTQCHVLSCLSLPMIEYHPPPFSTNSNTTYFWILLFPPWNVYILEYCILHGYGHTYILYVWILITWTFKMLHSVFFVVCKCMSLYMNKYILNIGLIRFPLRPVISYVSREFLLYYITECHEYSRFSKSFWTELMKNKNLLYWKS